MEMFYAWLYKWALKKWRKAAKNPEIKMVSARLTEHAVVRYLERVEGLDIEAVKARILTPEAIVTIEEIGGTGKFASNGVLYVVSQGKILTIAKAEGANQALAYADLSGGESQKGRRWTF